MKFTKTEGIVNFISENAIKILNLCHIPEDGKLKTLPLSRSESADNLARDRQLYEANPVFPQNLIDKTIALLKSHRDRNL